MSSENNIRDTHKFDDIDMLVTIGLQYLTTNRLTIKLDQAGKEIDKQFKMRVDECEKLEARANKEHERANVLQKFKDYVHSRLTDLGVPVDPDPVRTAATGCRIGQRLAWIENRIAGLEPIAKGIQT